MNTPNDSLFVFSGPGLDRLAIRRADESWLAEQLSKPTTRFVPLAGEDSLLDTNGAPLFFDAHAIESLRAFTQSTVLLGEYHNQVCFALGLAPDTPLPPGTLRTNLRPQFDVIEDDTLALLGYARTMVHWHNHNRCCGKCGATTESRRAGHELHCTRCSNIIYPRVNPAIITLVTHQEHCLLGHQANWADTHYSTIAGFVEPGEDPEATLRRELWEETNIRVDKLEYRYAQPWPYLASLMLGYRAQAVDTDIRCNDHELLDARWFSRADIVHGLREGTLTLSPSASISHRLIREWFDAAGQTALDTLIRRVRP